MIATRAIAAADSARWLELWDGYNRFYETDLPPRVTEQTLARLLDPATSVIGRIAEYDGRVAGFSASIVHPSTWEIEPVCYLEDLFVDPAARGHGIGRALIEDLIAQCHERGWSRLYWHTRADNLKARRLYDQFSSADDFVRYRLFRDGR